MPILRKVKITCKSCGWHLIISSDCLNPATDRVLKCGKCGCTDLKHSKPSFIDSISPIERGRTISYLASLKRMKSKGNKQDN